MQIAYILSGKNGITSFTYRELELLESKGISFCLCFTQLKLINNVPKYNWKYIVASKRAIISNIIKLIISPAKLRLMFQAFRQHELVWFLIALSFSSERALQGTTNIHVQMANQKLLLGYYLGKILNLNALTCTLHAHELYSEFRYDKPERFRDVLNSCKTVFTISEFNRKILIDDLHVIPSKIRIMYLYPSFEADTTLRNKVKFLVTANWEKKKGYEEIVQAIKNLHRDDFVVLIAGRNVNPEDGVDLTSIIKKEKLESKIILLGHLNMATLKLLYNMCDVFILPSKTDFYLNGLVRDREGIPVSLMEAMSFGMPIITTKHAGIPELVNEFLIDEGDTVALEKAMSTLIDNLSQYKMQAAANIDLVNNKFNESNIEVLIKGL